MINAESVDPTNKMNDVDTYLLNLIFHSASQQVVGY